MKPPEDWLIEKLNIIGDAVKVARIPNAIEAGYTLAASI